MIKCHYSNIFIDRWQHHIILNSGPPPSFLSGYSSFHMFSWVPLGSTSFKIEKTFLARTGPDSDYDTVYKD